MLSYFASTRVHPSARHLNIVVTHHGHRAAEGDEDATPLELRERPNYECLIINFAVIVVTEIGMCFAGNRAVLFLADDSDGARPISL